MYEFPRQCPDCRARIHFAHWLKPDFSELVVAFHSIGNYADLVGSGGRILQDLMQLIDLEPAQENNHANPPLANPPAQNQAAVSGRQPRRSSRLAERR